MNPAPPAASLDAIFKAYDIRGVYPDQIDETIARLVGNAFVGFTGAARVLVGRERAAVVRATCGSVHRGRVAGRRRRRGPRPRVHRSRVLRGRQPRRAAAMFTASHNPAQYNGIKLCRAGAAPVGEDTGLRQLKAVVAEGLLERAEEPGRLERRDLLGPFVTHVRSFVDLDALRPMRVIADTANGVGGLIVPAVFSGLPFDLSVLFAELDGTFPNHPADPIQPENLRDLQREVLAERADVGLAFDGDADRVFLVDDQAVPLSGSTTTAILAHAILNRSAGGNVVHNLICSRSVPEVIREAGGTPIRSRVGHSFIKGVMAETDAIFGGEHSAHYYFRDNFRADSGVIAALDGARAALDRGGTAFGVPASV